MEPVRQNILIADSLIVQYRDVMNRYMTAWSANDDGEMSVLRAELERVYSSIWEHLDDAATRTRGAKRSTASYDAIRQTPGLEIAAAVADVKDRVVSVGPRTVTSELTVTHNQEGIRFAARGADALRAIWPELDWTERSEPEVDLRPRGLLSRLFGRK